MISPATIPPAVDTITEMRHRLAALTPVQTDIKDDSAHHKGHAGVSKHGGGHFRLTIVSQSFNGKSTLQRHRLVYTSLGDMMQSSIHALAIRALTADEANHQPNPKDI